MGLCNSAFKRRHSENSDSWSRDVEIKDDELTRANMGEYFSFSGRKMQAKIVSVYDGDTCTAVFRCFPDPKKSPLIQYRIRMVGVDTPELKPLLSTPNRENIVAKAKEAKKAVEDKILNKIVILDCQGFDKYGRILATITVEGLNLNEWLIAQNYAVIYDGGTKEETK
jgi:endonuclease YncB( thermonuclease family)